MFRRAAGVLALFFALAPIARAQPAAPPEGAWLRYHYEQRLVDGTGAYEGYSEATIAHARYEVVRVGPRRATIRGRYAWAYSSPDRRDSGVEDRTVAFTLDDRRYVGPRTDVSDYDEDDPRTLATWIWIAPSSSPAREVRILDAEFDVTARGLPVEIAGEPRSAIVLTSTRQGRRDDAYGNFTTEITDRYWYDLATGMFLREVHEERASGTFEGQSAGFTLRTTIELVDSSYAPAANPPPEDDYGTPPVPPYFPPADGGGGAEPSILPCLALAVPCFAFVLVLFFIVRATRRRRRRPSQTALGEQFVVREPSTQPLAGLSPLFDPFLPHLVGVARATKQPVACAIGASGAVLGVAIGDRAAAVGTIFAKDSDVCEALRLEIGQSEFFSEVRHPALASVTKLGLSSPNEAYNVYETYELMELTSRPAELGYDTNVISRMKDTHLPEVKALLDAVYGVPSGAWLDASVAAGDLGWVAEHEGRVVGVALATVVGTRARLHTLTVHPGHRSQGFGTALYRARLRALFDMGVTHVLTECATWNVGALELARAHGFTKAGVMYVESARSQRDERKFVRR